MGTSSPGMSLFAGTLAALLKGSVSTTANLLASVPLLRLLVLRLLDSSLRVVLEESGAPDAKARAETVSEPEPESEPEATTQAKPCPIPVASDPHRPTAHLLTLPFEIRLEIYSYLLLVPSSPRDHRVPQDDVRVHPALLATCAQVHAEAMPLLYAGNTFQAHYSLLTSLPRLRASLRPVTQARPLAHIRRWWMRIRLDAGCPFTEAAVTAAFTGMDEVVLDIWQTTFWGGAGVGPLERFEAVRGVRKVRVLGSTTGFEGYLRWLAQSMTAPVGREVTKYIPVDETERKRLRGWS